jgi:hypothetical protein
MNIDVSSYSGSRYRQPHQSYGTGAVMDGPDQQTEIALMKLNADPNSVSREEWKRLAGREHLERENLRTGGTSQRAITRRRLTPFEKGRREREMDEGYNAGRKGSPGAAPSGAAPAPQLRKPDQPPAGIARPSPNTSQAPTGPGADTGGQPQRWPAGQGPRYNFGRLSAPRTDIDDAGNPSGAAPKTTAPATNSPTAPTAPAAGPMALGGFRAQARSFGRPADAAAPAVAPALIRKPAVTVRPRTFGDPQKLASPVAPAVGAGPDGSFVGGGGDYMAEFGTRRSAREFADFASRATAAEAPSPGRIIPRRLSDQAGAGSLAVQDKDASPSPFRRSKQGRVSAYSRPESTDGAESMIVPRRMGESAPSNVAAAADGPVRALKPAYREGYLRPTTGREFADNAIRRKVDSAVTKSQKFYDSTWGSTVAASEPDRRRLAIGAAMKSVHEHATPTQRAYARRIVHDRFSPAGG